MPPVKHVTTKDINNGTALTGKAINTRVRNHLAALKEDNGLPKRKAESPIKGKTTKRSAFGDITNVRLLDILFLLQIGISVCVCVHSLSHSISVCSNYSIIACCMLLCMYNHFIFSGLEFDPFIIWYVSK